MTRKKADAPTTKRQLNAKTMFQLTNLVANEYVASGLSDTAFAKVASTKLGLDIGESSIATARHTLDLQSNREAQILASTDQSAAIAELRGRVARLETIVNVLKNYAQKAGPIQELSGLQFHIGEG